MPPMLRPAIAAALVIAAAAPAAGAFEILYAVDGDSLQGRHNRQARLLCIDAPELKQRGGQAARQKLQALIRGELAVEQRGTDHYDRHLLLLTRADGVSVNLALIRSGHAWAHRYHAGSCGIAREVLFAAENEARREKRGLWRQQNPTPPWQWRKQNPRTN